MGVYAATAAPLYLGAIPHLHEVRGAIYRIFTRVVRISCSGETETFLALNVDRAELHSNEMVFSVGRLGLGHLCTKASSLSSPSIGGIQDVGKHAVNLQGKYTHSLML